MDFSLWRRPEESEGAALPEQWQGGFSRFVPVGNEPVSMTLGGKVRFCAILPRV